MNIKTIAKTVDRKLADLHQQLAETEHKIDAKAATAHVLVGDRKTYRGRKSVWSLTDEEALKRLEAGTGVAAYDVERGRKVLADRRALQDRAAEIHAEIAELDAVHREHRWARFFLVEGGHIHSGLRCAGGTIRISTRLGWLPELSGEPIADAVAAHGPNLCTHCFPTAPVEWKAGLKKVEDPSKCASQNTVPGSFRARYNGGQAKCADCGAGVSLTTTGTVRKHKRGA